MSYQRDGKATHQWKCWIDANRALIDRLNLPRDVIASRDQFEYLLQHGYSQSGWWNKQPWFEVSDAIEWKALFWQLLESYVNEFIPYEQRSRLLESLTRDFAPREVD